jgi:hypothetical protein
MEAARPVVGAATLEVGHREVGADGRLLHGCYVLLGSVGGVADDPAHPRPPAEARPPELVEHGLVLHDVRRGDQHV